QVSPVPKKSKAEGEDEDMIQASGEEEEQFGEFREKTEEQQRKEEEKNAKRIAYIFEHASEWIVEPRDSIPMELIGDSSTGVNWINGLWTTSNIIYPHIMGDIQNRLEQISVSFGMRPPSWGHNLFEWIYREGNERVDRLTWLARTKNSYVAFHTSLIEYASKTKLDGLRGFFDGGRSVEGCAAGWCIDLCVHGTWQLVAEEAFSLHASASVMFCEMIAAEPLCMAVEHVLGSLLHPDSCLISHLLGPVFCSLNILASYSNAYASVARQCEDKRCFLSFFLHLIPMPMSPWLGSVMIRDALTCYPVLRLGVLGFS
ncbi:unnamed protein product, partial [Prorocentrum cordatum]